MSVFFKIFNNNNLMERQLRPWSHLKNFCPYMYTLQRFRKDCIY
jgi:hypothetical protein